MGGQNMTWRSRRRKTRRTRRSMRCFCSKTHARRSLRCFCSKTHEEEEAGRRAGGGVCAVFVQRHKHRAFFFHRHLNKLLSFHLFTLSFAAILRPFTQTVSSRSQSSSTHSQIHMQSSLYSQSSSVFLLGKNARRKGRKENRVR